MRAARRDPRSPASTDPRAHRSWACLPSGHLAPTSSAPSDEPSEHAGSQAAQRDLGQDHDRDEPDHPRPDLHADARLAAGLEERLSRLAERRATGQLRQLAQQGLVDTEIAKLLRIRYHQPRELGANDALVAALRHADQVHPFLGRREPAAVLARSDLLEIDDGALPVRGDDANL